MGRLRPKQSDQPSAPPSVVSRPLHAVAVPSRVLSMTANMPLSPPDPARDDAAGRAIDGNEDRDAMLLAAYAAGDGVAAGQLVARHVPWLVAFAGRMLGGDGAEAEDVAQEAMLRLWRIAPDWHPGRAQVRTWLYRVATNLCTDRLRRRARARPLGPDDDVADPAAGALAGMIAADRVGALRSALQTLPDRQRQAVVLRHLEGLANPQIAQIMDTGVEAVESLLARGRRALVSTLAPRRGSLGYEDDND